MIFMTNVAIAANCCSLVGVLGGDGLGTEFRTFTIYGGIVIHLT